MDGQFIRDGDLFYDPNRFRLPDDQWELLSRDFNLSHNMLFRNNEELFGEVINWDWVARWQRFKLEDACSAFYSENLRTADRTRQMKALKKLAAALRSTTEDIKALPYDGDFARMLSRDMRNSLPESSFSKFISGLTQGYEEPPKWICDYLAEHLQVATNSALAEIARIKKRTTRRPRKPGIKLLLQSLCEYWEDTLHLPVRRTSDYISANKFEPPISPFLIRVPMAAFGELVTDAVADHAIRSFNKQKKQDLEDFGTSD